MLQEDLDKVQAWFKRTHGVDPIQAYVGGSRSMLKYEGKHFERTSIVWFVRGKNVGFQVDRYATVVIFRAWNHITRCSVSFQCSKVPDANLAWMLMNLLEEKVDVLPPDFKGF